MVHFFRGFAAANGGGSGVGGSSGEGRGAPFFLANIFMYIGITVLQTDKKNPYDTNVDSTIFRFHIIPWEKKHGVPQ